MTARRRRGHVRITRARLLLTAGLVGIGLETYYSLRFHQEPNSTLVIAFCAMIGLPVYFHEDSKREHDGSAGSGSGEGERSPVDTPRPQHDDA